MIKEIVREEMESIKQKVEELRKIIQGTNGRLIRGM